LNLHACSLERERNHVADGRFVFHHQYHEFAAAHIHFQAWFLPLL
jgi:hypothetical protein